MSTRERTLPGSSSRMAGLAAIQVVVSIGSFIQMVLFARVLDKSTFGQYAVWYTTLLFIIGIFQALVGETSLLGRRSATETDRVSFCLALVLWLPLAAIAGVMRSEVLVLISLAVPLLLHWDKYRFSLMHIEPWRVARREAGILLTQVMGVVTASLASLDSAQVLGTWWVAGSVGYLLLSDSARIPRRQYLEGARVLWRERSDAGPVLIDALFAGLPIVGALYGLGFVAGAEQAAEARVALTLLGPLAVLMLVLRRATFLQVGGRGEYSARIFYRLWVAGVGSTIAYSCVVLLITHTSVFERFLEAYTAVPLLAILFFTIDRTSLFAAILPAAWLRSAGLPQQLRNGRFLGAVAAGVTGLVSGLGSITAFAATICAGSMTYLLYSAIVSVSRRARGSTG